MTLKASIRTILILSAFATTSCQSKDSAAIRRPFSNFYNFTINNEPYKLSLMRDTSGGYCTYDGIAANAITSDFVSTNPDGIDSARPDALKLEFYSSGQKGFSFSGTVSPDGTTIEGLIKRQQQATPSDSTRCTMQAGGKLPFALFARTMEFPSIGDSTAAPSTFSVRLVWPQAGIPAITAMRYKKDVAELLKIKSNMYNYSVSECLQQYLQNCREYVQQEDFKDATGFSHHEEVGTTLIYAGEKWVTLSFYNSFHDQLMAHQQGGTKFRMYNMRTGNHPRLSHFFTNEGLRKIPALLAKYFRIMNDLKPGEPLTKTGLYDNYILPNNNYYVTGDALHFYYNAYEIAPYAFGEFDIAIPLTEFGTDFRYQPN